MPTTTEILSFAPGASYLAANEIRKGLLFSKNKTSPILNQQIYAVYFILNKIYTLNPTYPGVDTCAQYLWELMGKYGVKSQGLAGGGGSISPVTPPTSAITPYDFLVLSSGTLFVNGQLTAQLPDAWRGFNIIFFRGGQPQSILNTGGTYYSWDSVNAIMTVSTAAFFGENFQIYPVI